MNKLLILLTVFFYYQTVIAGDYAQQANDNPFLNGKFNPKYKGEKTALQGEIVEIILKNQKYPLYKLNLPTKGIKDIWVASISTPPKGGINIGDMVVFKGFITTTIDLDPSGEIENTINSKTLLLSLYVSENLLNLKSFKTQARLFSLFIAFF